MRVFLQDNNLPPHLSKESLPQRELILDITKDYSGFEVLEAKRDYSGWVEDDHINKWFSHVQ